jgi:hypothetical protein
LTPARRLEHTTGGAVPYHFDFIRQCEIGLRGQHDDARCGGGTWHLSSFGSSHTVSLSFIDRLRQGVVSLMNWKGWILWTSRQ